MNKPQEFQAACLASQNMPYLFAAEYPPAPVRDGGVLGKGQLVWTCKVDGAKERPREVAAFVEGVGLISLDPPSLMRAGE
jgi:hypothetical protein